MSIKRFYLSNLCACVLGPLFAVQTLSANEREAVYFCAGEHGSDSDWLLRQ